MRYLLTIAVLLTGCCLPAQPFYLGADLSYVNEMEDCGVVYREEGVAKDPYQIFADNGANLVRLRMWHTPSWYDSLNDGHRYSDFQDVKRSIARAKAAGMAVLLDFHFSDTWTDPSRQIVPAAWADVVDDLPVLKDSLYRYVTTSLSALAAEDLLPDMVQVGNETNKGIMQSAAADAAGWALDWPRNAALFNEAIRAIREVAAQNDTTIQIALHIAGPENAAWLLDGFSEYGVLDFDVIGLSYYWAWHQPTTIGRTGEIIAELKTDFPGKKVMIFETGYIWTNASNDTANNIISEVQSGYAPASPNNQRRWLVDLTKEVARRGGDGVCYWEPAWVSSRCRTQWGQGSHQEHATFFDFENNVLPNGGMKFYGEDYDGVVSVETPATQRQPFRVLVRPDQRALSVIFAESSPSGKIMVIDMAGRSLLKKKWRNNLDRLAIDLPELPTGTYVLSVHNRKMGKSSIQFFLAQGE